MSSIQQGHLTDDQFAECAIVAPSPESEAHLRDCPQCCEELARFSESMDNFSMAAIGWSEAQPAASLRAVAHSQPRKIWVAPAAWAMAAALLIAAGVPLVMHHNRQPAAPSDAALPVASDDSDAQIAEDNRLMRSVNMAIGVNDPSPLREYGLQPERRPRLKTVSGLRSE